MCQQRKLQFKDYNNCLKAIQLENKTNHIEKNKNNTKILRENDFTQNK